MNYKAWTACTCLILAMGMGATAASAATPATSTIEGVLSSTGGVAVADGTYLVTFSIYEGKDAKTVSWAEGPVKLPVTNGRFAYALGGAKPLDAKLLSKLKSPWFGVSVGNDPELPRQPLRATPYALVAATADSLACSGCVSAGQVANDGISAAKVGFTYAASATKGGPASDLACSGCVSVKELKFDGDVNLGANSLKAKNGTFTGDLAAATVTATKFVGDGSALTGIKIPSGTCKAGLVVSGINPDGSLKCVQAMDPKGLPANGLNEVSNDLLTNQFSDKIAAADVPVGIPDNQLGKLAVSTINFPDIGLVEQLSLTIDVANTDLAALKMTVTAPNKAKFVICDPCGKKDAKSYKQTISATTKIKSGDLKSLVGQNVKGAWKLEVLDSSFCIPQAPGNDKLCNTTAKTDGQINGWSVVTGTLSSKKVHANGLLHTKGGLVLQNLTSDPGACSAAVAGYIFFNTKLKSLSVCDGKDWIPVALSPLGTSQNPGVNCKDIYTKRPGVTDGNYWIDPDGAGPVGGFQVFCDMKGGGWTRVDETSNYANKVYSEGSKYYNFTYSLTTAQINALKKVSGQGKQTWSCATKGVGSQNYYRGWDDKTYPQSSSGTCWHSNNSSTVSGNGTHTSFARLPLKQWQSIDCGDGSEYCSYNVGAAWFK